jgi:hypothetical protein
MVMNQDSSDASEVFLPYAQDQTGRAVYEHLKKQ